MANLQVELAEVEEVIPTLEDQQQVSRGVGSKWKTRQRLINSPRKEVEKLIKDVDHTICGPPCESCLCRSVLGRSTRSLRRYFQRRFRGDASFEAY